MERVRGELGRTYPMLIGAELRTRRRRVRGPVADRHRASSSRASRSAPGRTSATPIAAARAAFPAWRDLGWRKRLEIIRRAADLISERQFDYAALMSFEVGKNRLEALGDVEETADLLRYYSDGMEKANGFVQPMGSLSPAEHTRSILKPHGVWAVISPFNFPMALAGGPAAGALIAGNTVVMKPQLGRAADGLQVLRGAARRRHRAGRLQLRDRPGRDGRRGAGGEPGHRRHGLHRQLRGRDAALHAASPRDYPRPIITEMGGKNPSIVTASADLDEAAEGVMRSAFGFDGQKCSANSRVYVERSVARPFLDLLVEKARTHQGRRPDRARELDGPGHQRARRSASSPRRSPRRRPTAAGSRSAARSCATRRPSAGYFPMPTVVSGLPTSHRLFRDELFVPFIVVGEVDSLDEALSLSNATAYGLTAGIFSHDDEQIRRSWTPSRPGSCTSTGAPARPPGRGRGSSPSAAGRARAHRARAAWARTTSSSSCASSRRP